MDIAAWLRGLGLERYEADFRDNEINWAVLPKLTADDLKDIGVIAVGHRRMLLEAIAALDTAEAPPPATAAPASVGEAERRQLTVMFCDLVGSTPQSLRAACAGGLPRSRRYPSDHRLSAWAALPN